MSAQTIANPVLCFNTHKIKPGDIITMQTTTGPNALISFFQGVTGVSSESNTTYHTAAVVGIEDREIILLESTHYSGDAMKHNNGVAIRSYTPENFLMGYAEQAKILANSDLHPYLLSIINRFSLNYNDVDSMTRYGHSHLLSAALSTSHDTKKGRFATLYSRLSGLLMTSNGDLRRKAICSELVAEIVKIAQINLAFGTSAEDEELLGKSDNIIEDEHKLEELEKAGVVLNVESSCITPGRLEEYLVKKHGFSGEIINVVQNLE